ncbi:MAG: hypothetical protein A2868_03560 [Candidatus Levybacteria bacterium RIFCSPHIGHO2_01_FULL_40_15b]|nr:MAG: hypothetical protein A2868_03560 [Candidatus Levybacteria bacterium RIFCSPHIGHO2_01_FULL_40_15b]
MVNPKEPTYSEDQVEALFDSGFSGDVSVPAELVGNGKAPPPEGHVPITIADGSVVWVPSYEGHVTFKEFAGRIPQPIGVSVFVMGNEVLVGRNLMNHFKVTLDHGRTLTIEP